ncbi:MAG: hypothetical protein AAFR14_03765 [Bacteroidota bacterium]
MHTASKLTALLVFTVIVNIGIPVFGAPSLSKDTLSKKKPTKEIIVISYADLAEANLSGLMSYIGAIYDQTPAPKVIVKNYGSASELEVSASLGRFIEEMTSAAVHDADVVIVQEKAVNNEPYFSITISSSDDVQ